MPRNGSGVYSLPAGLPANGETSNATDDILTPFGDLETDMNTARPVVAGGTGATSASAARTNLGLGSIATQAASSVAITGGTINGTAIGGTTPAAVAGTSGTFTGLTVDASVPALTLDDSDTATTHNKVAIQYNSQVFRIQLRDNADAAVSTFLDTTMSATEVVSADFKTGGSSRIDLSNSGVRLGGANARVTTVLDEDTMSSDSATALATQQSIKAYVDATAATITLGTEQVATSGTQVDFTGISSNAKAIHINLEACSLTSTANFLIQLGDSGGFETTGYVAGSGASTGSNAGAVTSGFPIYIASAASSWDGTMTLRLKDSSNNTWTASHAGAINNGVSVSGGGNKSLSGTLTQIRITNTGTGTNSFDGSGSINIQVET